MPEGDDGVLLQVLSDSLMPLFRSSVKSVSESWKSDGSILIAKNIPEFLAPQIINFNFKYP